jgi:hypothetical protein
MTTTRPQTRAHLEWEIGQMLEHLKPRHLETSELAAMAEALRPAHARFMEIPTGSRPVLRIVPVADEEDKR